MNVYQGNAVFEINMNISKYFPKNLVVYDVLTKNDE